MLYCLFKAIYSNDSIDTKKRATLSKSTGKLDNWIRIRRARALQNQNGGSELSALCELTYSGQAIYIFRQINLLAQRNERLEKRKRKHDNP